MSLFDANQQSYSVLDLGFDRLLTKPMPQSNTLVTPEMLNSITQGLSSKTIQSGDLSATQKTVAGFTIRVAVGDNIQEAIDLVKEAGGGTVLLENGTHKPSSNITLYSNIVLEGQNFEAAVIDFNSQSYGVISSGSSIYTTGTITSISTFTVTGSGTAWLANVTTSHQFFIDDRWYLISSIDSDTQITLTEPYGGDATFPGASYKVAVINTNPELRNVKVINSATTGIHMQYCRELVMNKVTASFNNKGIVLEFVSDVASDVSVTTLNTNNGFEILNCSTLDFETILSFGNGGVGLLFNSANTFGVGTSACVSNTGNGLSFTSTRLVSITNIEANNNGGKGIEFIGSNNRTTLIGAVSGNTSDGIKLTASSDNVSLIGLKTLSNGGYGVNIAASSCDNTVIVGGQFSGNSSGAINDSGSSTIISGNTGVASNNTDITILKSVNETVNNSSIFQDDDELQFPVIANTHYKVHMFISMSCQNASDYKWQWSLPVGATFIGYGMQSAGGAVQRITEIGFFETFTSTGQCNMWVMGVLSIGANAGTAIVQWAQQAAAVEDTIWQAGSWLTYKKI